MDYLKKKAIQKIKRAGLSFSVLSGPPEPDIIRQRKMVSDFKLRSRMFVFLSGFVYLLAVIYFGTDTKFSNGVSAVLLSFSIIVSVLLWLSYSVALQLKIVSLLTQLDLKKDRDKHDEIGRWSSEDQTIQNYLNKVKTMDRDLVLADHVACQEFVQGRVSRIRT